MTAHVLVAGTLFRYPEQRTSKAGKPFVTATLRTKDGEASQWWKALAFSETAQAELMRLPAVMRYPCKAHLRPRLTRRTA